MHTCTPPAQVTKTVPSRWWYFLSGSLASYPPVIGREVSGALLYGDPGDRYVEEHAYKSPHFDDVTRWPEGRPELKYTRAERVAGD